MTQILFPLLSILPLGLLALVVRHWCSWAFESTPRIDTPKPLPHPAGDSTQKRLEQVARQLQDVMGLALALVPILGASYFLAIRDFITPPASVWGPQLAVAAVAYTLVFVRMARLLAERRDLRLKFNGERIVGKELDHLASDDCQVFHDLPLTAHWHIDHVVVAASGVYAVQTNYRRTGKLRASQRPHEVIYDGEGLQFPGYYDSDMLDQIRRRADRLSRSLSEALKSEINVKPVLALPGWLIRRETGDRIDVLNEYEVHRLGSDSSEPSLLWDDRARIAFHLNNKRRLAEVV
jgi:hypothetical protein